MIQNIQDIWHVVSSMLRLNIYLSHSWEQTVPLHDRVHTIYSNDLDFQQQVCISPVPCSERVPTHVYPHYSGNCDIPMDPTRECLLHSTLPEDNTVTTLYPCILLFQNTTSTGFYVVTFITRIQHKVIIHISLINPYKNFQ